MINGIAPFVWILLGAIVVLLPGIVMLLGRGGPRCFVRARACSEEQGCEESYRKHQQT